VAARRIVQICLTLLTRADLNPELSATEMIHRPGQGGRENGLQGSIAAPAVVGPVHLGGG
jgi:hypothetical protein